MYPHVVQFETRRQQLELELQLIRERSQPSATRTEAGLRGRPATQTPEHLELQPAPTTGRTPA
jgi:hypothetical protein